MRKMKWMQKVFQLLLFFSFFSLFPHCL